MPVNCGGGGRAELDTSDTSRGPRSSTCYICPGVTPLCGDRGQRLMLTQADRLVLPPRERPPLWRTSPKKLGARFRYCRASSKPLSHLKMLFFFTLVQYIPRPFKDLWAAGPHRHLTLPVPSQVRAKFAHQGRASASGSYSLFPAALEPLIP